MRTTTNDFPLQLADENIPIVRFQNVTKRYGDLVVLDSLNLDVTEGEMVTIIGPSGSGKTTVLRMLMALELIDEGVIYVNGEPMTHMGKNGKLVRASKKHLRKMRTNIGMCFQHFNLFPHMTALENCIEAPIQVLGLNKKEACERAEELLDMVGLLEKCHEHPARLSGGQKQRVAIARSLAMRPRMTAPRKRGRNDFSAPFSKPDESKKIDRRIKRTLKAPFFSSKWPFLEFCFLCLINPLYTI
jgi:polar amino acid transport system ATP-binding protein